jgi:hypothetical protein
MAFELNEKIITGYIAASTILTSALSSQLGVSSEALLEILLNNPKWTVSKAGKWTLAVNTKKLIASVSTDERRIDFSTN